MMEKFFDINESGVSVRCKLYARDVHAIRRAVIFCHGFGGHKDNRAAARFAEKITSKHKDTAVCAFDWPCHGDDAKKKLRLADCSLYLELVMHHMKERFGAQELYAYGTSFGGYLLLCYLHEHGNPFRKIVLRCPAIPMYETLTKAIMSGDDLEKMEKGREVLVGFDRKIRIDHAFLEELKAMDVTGWTYLDDADDILILHGTEDEIVPLEGVAKFADDNVVELIPIEGADHRFRNPQKMDYVIAQIIEFYQMN